MTTVDTWAWSFQELWERVQNPALWVSDSERELGKLHTHPLKSLVGTDPGDTISWQSWLACKQAERLAC